MAVKAVRTPSPPEDSRSRILEAAHALFGEHGSADVTMAEVAERAGLSRATVFNQFGSKHGLVEGVTEGVYQGYEAILENALADRTTPVPVLVHTLFEVMGNGIANDARFYRTVFREIGRVNVGLEEGGDAQQAYRRAGARIVHLMTRGQARGEIATRFAPEDLATVFDSLVFGTLTEWLYGDDSQPLPTRMQAAAEIFLGPVAQQAADAYVGPKPELYTEGDSPFGTRPGGSET